MYAGTSPRPSSTWRSTFRLALELVADISPSAGGSSVGGHLARTAALAGGSSGRNDSEPACQPDEALAERGSEPAASGPIHSASIAAASSRTSALGRSSCAPSSPRTGSIPRTEPLRNASEAASSRSLDSFSSRTSMPSERADLDRACARDARKDAPVRGRGDENVSLDGEHVRPRGLEDLASRVEQQRHAALGKVRLQSTRARPRSAHLCAPRPPGTTNPRSATARSQAGNTLARSHGGRDGLGGQLSRRLGHDRHPQPPERQRARVLQRELAGARRQIAAVQLSRAVPHPLQVGVELDRAAVADQERLEDAGGRVGRERPRHGPILPFRGRRRRGARRSPRALFATTVCCYGRRCGP